MIDKLNKYDYYVIVLIASLSAGEFGGALQMARAVTILLIPALIKAGMSTPKYIIKQPRLFVTTILSWCIISLAWTGSFYRGLEELVYFVVHMLYFMEIVVFTFKSNKKIISIGTGWAIAVLTTSVVAIWEIRTGQHLVTGKIHDEIVLHTGFVRRFASATFYNFNDYEVFLCYSAPFLLAAISKIKKLKNILFFFISLLFVVVIVFFNASRGAIFSIVIMVSIGLWGVIKQNSKSKESLVIMVALLLFALYEYSGDILMNITARLEMASMFESGRTDIWYLTLLCLENTMFIGTGIAGIEKGMSVVSNHYLAPHNMFLEILVEFGVFIFIYIIVTLYKMFRHVLRGNSQYKLIILSTFLAWPIISIVSSKYLLFPDLYAFIASFYILVYNEKYA